MSRVTVKELLLGLLTAASSIAVFWLWREALPRVAAGEYQHYTDFIIPFGGLVVSAALFSLAALFIKQNKIIYPVMIVSFGTPFLFVGATNIIAGIFVATALLISFAVYRIQQEVAYSLGFSIVKTLKSGLPLYFTIFALVLAVLYSANLDEEKAVSSLLPKPALYFSLQSLGGFAKSLIGLPVINPDATVDELLKTLLEEQLRPQGLNFANLPAQEIRRLLIAQRQELSRQFGIDVSGNEKIIDIFYTATIKRLRELLGPYTSYLPAISALVFFFAFKTLTVPLYYLTLLITALLIRLLRAVNVVRSERQQVEVERLTL